MQWVRTEDRFPEPSEQKILVVYNANSKEIHIAQSDGFAFFADPETILSKPTHWLQLPDPPGD